MPALQSSRRTFSEDAQLGATDLTPAIMLANARRADLLDEVAAGRLATRARAASRAGVSADAWRYRLGLRIVRFGGWLQGAGERAPLSSGRRGGYA